MQLQLNGNPGTLIDGSTSWNEVAESALSSWNGQIDVARFAAVRGLTVAPRDGDGVNNVFFSETYYGRGFGSALSISSRWTSRGRRIESDVVVNSTLSWNAYRGNARSSGGTPVQDLRRVLLHEFGHVLGLEHPDDAGQVVPAIMNSTIGDLDTLTDDDRAGARSLYSPGGVSTIGFPPRNEGLDFRTQLETKYRNDLRRVPLASFVDLEGVIVWTSEYLRYRIGLCSHETAVARVFSAIDSKGVLGVCGAVVPGEVRFPPRNETLDFRTQLEAKYRDGLRRPPITTAVDNEGDVVWTQEYLRYRVNGCGHADAIDKVFVQLNGGGVQPACQ
jgi:hypothetical protein